MLREAYLLAAINMKRARDRQPNKKTRDLSKFKVRDLVPLKNHKEQKWDAKYMPNFCICKAIKNRAYELQGPCGHVRCSTVADIQLLMPTECIVSMLLDIKAFGQLCKFINDPSLMPDLKWQKSNPSNVPKSYQNVDATKYR